MEECSSRKRFLDATSRMNVETIKISSNLHLTDVPFETYVRELRLLADQAADVGARLAMEFIPFAHFSDPRSASELIVAADHPMAGLCVDIWHVYRSGMHNYDELVATVPHDKIFLVVLNDATPAPQSTLIEDSCNWRRYIPARASSMFPPSWTRFLALDSTVTGA